MSNRRNWYILISDAWHTMRVLDRELPASLSRLVHGHVDFRRARAYSGATLTNSERVQTKFSPGPLDREAARKMR